MTDNLSQRIAEWVREGLERNGWTQQQLADHLGITQANVSRKLRGQQDFQVDQLPALADFFRVPLPTILGGQAAGNSGQNPVSAAPPPRLGRARKQTRLDRPAASEPNPERVA